MIDEDKVRQQGSADGVTHYSTGIAAVRDGKILLVRRAAGDHLGGVYELPGGGVEENEVIQTAAVRELREETGLDTAKILGVFAGFDYSTPNKPKVRQANFLVEVKEGDVKLLPDEHDKYVWVSSALELDDLDVTGPMRTCVIDALNKLSTFKTRVKLD